MVSTSEMRQSFARCFSNARAATISSRAMKTDTPPFQRRHTLSEHAKRGVYHFSPLCNLTRQREARSRELDQPTAALKKRRLRISRAARAPERSASRAEKVILS